MFLSLVLIRASFLRLVPLMKLDEGFTELPTDQGSLINLLERVVALRSSIIFSLLLVHNSVSTSSPGDTVEKILAICSALAGRPFLRMSRKRSLSTAS